MATDKTWIIKPITCENYPGLAIACLPAEFMVAYDAYIASNKQDMRVLNFVSEADQSNLRALLVCGIRAGHKVGSPSSLGPSGWHIGVFAFSYDIPRANNTRTSEVWLMQRRADWLGTVVVDVMSRAEFWLPDSLEDSTASDLRDATSHRGSLTLHHESGFVTSIDTPSAEA